MSRIHQAIRRAESESKKSQMPETARVKAGLARIAPEVVQPVPSFGAASAVANLKPRPAATMETAAIRRCFELPEDPKLVAITAPRSVAGEQFRSLKAKLYRYRRENTLRSLLVTSAAPSDGKTLTTINLAMAIAQEIDQKVVLVDGDTRRPSVNHTLGLPLKPGLTDFLKGEVGLEEIILQTNLPGFFVIPAGHIPENPTELLNTQAMKDFFAKVTELFDWVIVDSPPAIPLADAEILSSLVDGILMVVRAGQTPTASISKCAETLKGKKVLGVVFNCVERARWSTHYSHYSYYNQNGEN